ncbi:MAG: cupredoxin domain-containing protein [Nitrospiraceae bacterium]
MKSDLTPSHVPFSNLRHDLFSSIVVFLVALTSCEPREQEVHIAAQDFRFSPATIRLHADYPIRLTIINEGREPHEFASPLLADSRVQVFSAPDSFLVSPGRSITVLFQAPPGTYPFRCRVRGHAGMEGTVIVEG